MSLELVGTLLLASFLAFGLAWFSSVGGVGGGVLMLFVFTALFGIQVAVPMLTLTQLASSKQLLGPVLVTSQRITSIDKVGSSKAT